MRRSHGFGHIIKHSEKDTDMMNARGYANGGGVMPGPQGMAPQGMGPQPSMGGQPQSPLQNPEVQARLQAATKQYGPEMVAKAVQAAQSYLAQRGAHGGGGPAPRGFAAGGPVPGPGGVAPTGVMGTNPAAGGPAPGAPSGVMPMNPAGGGMQPPPGGNMMHTMGGPGLPPGAPGMPPPGGPGLPPPGGPGLPPALPPAGNPGIVPPPPGAPLMAHPGMGMGMGGHPAPDNQVNPQVGRQLPFFRGMPQSWRGAYKTNHMIANNAGGEQSPQQVAHANAWMQAFQADPSHLPNPNTVRGLLGQQPGQAIPAAGMAQYG